MSRDGKQELALEVLETDRNTLMMALRFLDRALWKMPMRSDTRLDPIATDGVSIYYNVEKVLSRYVDAPGETLRDQLHLIFHCLFYHPFIGESTNVSTWNLATDIAVEAACIGLVAERFGSVWDSRRLQVIERFKTQFGNLSAEKIYHHLIGSSISTGDMTELSLLFFRDDHTLWYKDEACAQEESDKRSDEDRKQTEQSKEPDESQRADPDEEDDPSEERRDESSQEVPKPQGRAGKDPADFPQEALSDDDDGKADDDRAREEWEAISKQVKVDLETRSNQQGSKAGSMILQLQAANRRRYDYRDFLRRFTELGEEMLLSDDEFDQAFYTYGLKLYGNMPLIEPLEYQEVSKVREFVIALDTSGSCQGELIRRFVEETYSILKSAENFFNKVNIHIIQCDAQVQSDVKVTSDEEFERYLEDFTVSGMGGTDFRPVFRYVDELLREGSFKNLKGLLYFTDGKGRFPQLPPEYETAFIFIDNGFTSPNVPVWALKVVIDEAELKEKI